MRPGAWFITVQTSAVFPRLGVGYVIGMYFPAGQSVQERDPVLDTLPAAQALQAVSFMPPVVSFSFRCLLAKGGISVGMDAHTGGVQELSSSTGDASRIERVVVLVDTVIIAEDAFDTALVVAQVMRGEQIRGTAGEAVGGGWRGRQVGLGEVEPGGAPASHVFVKSSSTHERAGSGSTWRGSRTCRQRLDLAEPRQGSRIL